MSKTTLTDRIAHLSLSALSHNHTDSVESFCRLGLMIAPNSGIFFHHMGLALLIQDKVKEALPLLNTAIEKFKDSTSSDAQKAYRDLIVANLMGKSFDTALDLAQKADIIWPNNANIIYLAAQAAEGAKQLEFASKLYDQALSLTPTDHPKRQDMAFALGTLYYAQRKLGDAYAAFRIAVESNPLHTKAWCNLGNVLSDLAHPDEALKAYEAALRIEPTYCKAHSNYLQTLHYIPGHSANDLLAPHKAWAKQHYPNRPSQPPPPNIKRNRPCIGLVSEDLRQHPVGFFCKGWLPHAQAAGLDVIVYCHNRISDDITYAMKPHAAQWHYVDNLNDSQLAQLIRKDAPDILFDLAGHTGRNRLGTFAEQPAALQATWMGYVGTTGLPQMNALIADSIHVPKLEDKAYTEDIWRMPKGYICYEPPLSTPTPKDQAWKQSGHITFAAFHNPAKINADLITAWAKILNGVADSHLCLAYRGYDEIMVIDLILRTFQAHGITADRIDLHGALPHKDLLELYNQCDFALDSFPYAGGLTTLEALWMGIPVITTPGRTFASRHAASHLTFSGFAQDVTTSTSDYIRTAIAWAHSPVMRDADRKARRARFAASPLCDGKTFAQDLTSLIQQKYRYQTGTTGN